MCAGKKLDVLVSGGLGHRLAAEFKYHREVFSTLPKPQLAGGIFSDLFRLGIAHLRLKCQCYFIYLTDPAMNGYLKNPKYGCATVFSLPVGSRIPLGIGTLQGKPVTFRRIVNGYTNSIEVEAVFRTELANSRQLHVYSVEHVPEAADKWD